MRIDQPAHVRKPLPLVPLVDVVFLLLMFFMLSSTFTRFGDLDLLRNPSAAADGAESAAVAAPGVIVTVDRNAQFKVNGVATAARDIAASLDGFFAKGVRSGLVVLAPAAEVQDLVTVLEQARKSRLSLSVAR